VIRLTLAKNVAFNIMNENTTVDLMKAFSNMYEKPSAANKVYLIRWLVNLKMGEGNSINNHISEFNTIIAQLTLMQITFDDEVKALIFLSSLPESWSATVIAVSNFASNSKLKLDNIRDLIISEDVRRKSSGESSNSSYGLALSTETRGRSSQKGRNQGRDRSKSKGKSQPKFWNDITFWNCQKRGQFTNQCRTPRKHNNKKQDDDQSGNAATDEIEDALLFSLDSSIDSWIMDSGASFHTTHSLELLSNYITGKFGKVYLADEKSFDIIGKCDINIRTSNGSVWTLNNV